MSRTGGISHVETAPATSAGRVFDEVYHLKGGILKYFEEVPAEQSKWNCESLRPSPSIPCHVRTTLAAVVFVRTSALRLSPFLFRLQKRPLAVLREGVSCPRCLMTTCRMEGSRCGRRRAKA